MGYSVYYDGEIDISPELSDEHATLLDEALTKSNPALLDSYAFNRKQKYCNKPQAASSSWMMLRMDASALWNAASSLLLGRAPLLG